MWKSTRQRVMQASLALMLVATLWGCTSTQTTKERTESVTEPASAASSSNPPGPEGAGATQRKTTVTTTTEEKPHPGIVGSTFGVVGSVIAAPFRVIGGALSAIF